MKQLVLILIAGAMLAVTAQARAHADATPAASDSIWIGSFGRLHSWRAVSRDELIVWASPSRPDLVKMWRPFTSLRFANVIGVTSTVGRITKFDKVIVDGQRLPIKSIVALDRETAKSMRWTNKQRT